VRRGPVVLTMGSVTLAGVAEAIAPTPGIATPSITSPTEGATDVSAGLTVTASAFTVTNEGSDTHASSDWQISDDSGFSNIVEESLADTSNKTSYTATSLDNLTEYWVRVRYNGTTYGASGWSTPVSFTTADAPAYDTDAQAFFDAMGTAPNDAVKTAVDDLITGLKTDSVWAELDALWPLNMPTLADSLLNMKDPTGTAATAVNSPTHTPYVGIAGDGSTSYINTNWNPTDDGSSYVLDDCSMGIWLVGGTDTSSAKYAMGEISHAQLLPYWTTMRGGLNGSSQDQLGTVATRLGFSAVDRPDSSNIVGYRDGSGFTPFSRASSSLGDSDFFLGGRSNSGSLNAALDQQMSCAYVGGSLGGTKQTALYNRLNTFRTAMAAAAP
jgi:hypothetical protein